MQGDLHDFMSVGIVHFMAYPACMGGEGPVVETVSALCADPFWDLLEIAPVKDEAARETVRAVAEQARVDLAIAAQPVILGGKLDPNSADVAARAAAVKAVQGAVDQAHAMGLSGVAMLSGPVCEDYDEGKNRLTESLDEICAYAGERGIDIVLETFDQAPFGKNCLIGPTRDALDIAERLRPKHDNFGLLLDLSHLPLIGESSREALECARDHLAHVHIGNCAMDDPNHPAYGDNHPRFGAPGTRNDVPELIEFFKVLFDMGYLAEGNRPPVSFEVKPMPGEDVDAVIAGSKRALIEAWRAV